MNKKILKKMRDLIIMTYFSQSDITCEISLYGGEACKTCKNKKFCEEASKLDAFMKDENKPVNYRDMDRLTTDYSVSGLHEKIEEKINEMMQRRETVYEILMNNCCPEKQQENQPELKEMLFKSIIETGWHNLPLDVLLKYLSYCQEEKKRP